ncbi:MAG: efflux RND transporter periplasmic adaptor subunit [Candidatus Peribacteraceae bacterium]|nr:efflux RND transporter periplasmic adaptor subunit [Candidatus Peribacteraceae bacterium]
MSFLKRHYGKIIIILLIVVPVGGLTYYLSQPQAPTYITDTIRLGDLVQKVEAVGAVTSDRDLTLTFPTTGVVAKILVKEGDHVAIGQELARLKADALQADVSSAAAQLSSAQASLRELEEGSRPEDIAIAEAQVENKKAALDAAKTALATAEDKLKNEQAKLDSLTQEAKTSLSGYFGTSSSTIDRQLTVAETALKVYDGVIQDPAVQNILNTTQPIEFTFVAGARKDAEAAIDAVRMNIRPTFTDYRQTLSFLDQTRSAVGRTADTITRAYGVISNMTLAGGFTLTVREAHKTTLATQSTNTQTALGTLDSAIKDLRDASASFDTQIATAEAALAAAEGAKQAALSDILTYETSLRTQQAQLGLTKAGARKTQIDAARASVNSAYAALQRAKANLEDAILRAPVEGTITKVDFKIGEYTTGTVGAINMLGTSPYRIEMYTSEVDIPKVKLSQSGSIELDAFPGAKFALRVQEIDPAATDIDGVSKYRVVLGFVYPHEDLKIGMTGDAEIVTGERLSVLLAPVRSVLQNDAGEKIVRILDNGEVIEKPVKTGMESDTDVEIIDGLEEGETVVVLIKK